MRRIVPNCPGEIGFNNVVPASDGADALDVIRNKVNEALNK